MAAGCNYFIYRHLLLLIAELASIGSGQVFAPTNAQILYVRTPAAHTCSYDIPAERTPASL